MDTLDRDREPSRDNDVSQIFGLFNSGSADVASKKDSYVGAAAIMDLHTYPDESES
jgi:hypothetical protein